MKPGHASLPAVSITGSDWPLTAGPTAAMRSPSTATSAARAGPPAPSTTEPPRIRSDQATRSGLVDDDRLHPVALLDTVHVLHAGRDSAEHGVIVVEVGRGAVGDVELAARRVGMLAAGHRQAAPQVLLLVEFRLDRMAGATGAVALGAATLHHEVRNDAVEGEAVVEPLLGQRHEVLHRLGGV